MATGLYWQSPWFSGWEGHQIGLWLVYTLLVFLLASVMLFAHALRHEAHMLLRDAPELVIQREGGTRHALISAAQMETLRGIHGVNRVTARLWGYPVRLTPCLVSANSWSPVPEPSTCTKITLLMATGGPSRRPVLCCLSFLNRSALWLSRGS
ncbi:MAG: hypothetical protein HQM00_08505 [Magnetococcales bacterium]|nr:hypothetical protein [Magnetococcales bacterium]